MCVDIGDGGGVGSDGGSSDFGGGVGSSSGDRVDAGCFGSGWFSFFLIAFWQRLGSSSLHAV